MGNDTRDIWDGIVAYNEKYAKYYRTILDKSEILHFRRDEGDGENRLIRFVAFVTEKEKQMLSEEVLELMEAES